MPTVHKKQFQNKQNYLRNKENRREEGCTKYWENPRTSKRHVAGLVFGRTLTREGHLLECPIPVIGRTLRQKEHPPMPIIGRTLRQKEHPPMPVIGRTLREKGCLPRHLPMHVIGKMLRKEGQLPVYPPIALLL